MKALTLKFILLVFVSFNSLLASAGEVTGAGLTQILRDNNINVGLLNQQGFKVKTLKQGVTSPINQLKYLIKEREVFDTSKIRHIRFKEGQNNFMFKNIQEIDFNNGQVLVPSDVDGFVTKPVSRILGNP